ncbi:hypothetical protein PQQ87_05285 [Paraburkholderia nemoris]|uniref:hypothetical protein n=1 Tax=Paraburkholderia nemoris TaxID=2793076 RepID=UPI0038BDE6F2
MFQRLAHWVVWIVFVLSGCSTTTGSSWIVQRPAVPASDISIHYIRSPLTAKKPREQKRMDQVLAHEEYDLIGSRIAKLAPNLLAARHMTLSEFSETVADQPNSRDSASDTHRGSAELRITISQSTATTTRFAGTEAEVVFQFDAVLCDPQSSAIFWHGAYSSDAVPLSRWNVAFDDEALSKLLGRIFDDMAKKGVVSGTPVDSHADPMPLGVAGFGAPVRDASAVPLIDDRGRDGYRDWLRRPSPRAFVIASNGSWRATWGKTPPGEPEDAAERAMLHCHRSGLKECKLYAVDNAVVWESDSAHK